jgi:hypothetical protein
MGAAGRAAPLLWKSIEKHRVAILAESPRRLSIRRFGHIVRQDKVKAISLVSAAGTTWRLLG